jgi:hypothetical protein
MPGLFFGFEFEFAGGVSDFKVATSNTCAALSEREFCCTWVCKKNMTQRQTVILSAN